MQVVNAYVVALRQLDLDFDGHIEFASFIVAVYSLAAS